MYPLAAPRSRDGAVPARAAPPPAAPPPRTRAHRPAHAPGSTAAGSGPRAGAERPRPVRAAEWRPHGLDPGPARPARSSPRGGAASEAAPARPRRARPSPRHFRGRARGAGWRGAARRGRVDYIWSKAAESGARRGRFLVRAAGPSGAERRQRSHRARPGRARRPSLPAAAAVTSGRRCRTRSVSWRGRRGGEVPGGDGERELRRVRTLVRPRGMARSRRSLAAR